MSREGVERITPQEKTHLVEVAHYKMSKSDRTVHGLIEDQERCWSAASGLRMNACSNWTAATPYYR